MARLLVLPLLAAVVQAVASKARQHVTPVEKVIELLSNLQTKIEAEGKTDAAQYDKFACFCKEQADNKLYAIEKSQAKIERLTAKAAQLSTEIGDLNAEITELSASIQQLEVDIRAAAEKRAEEHAAYAAKEADMAGAIRALENAITALKDSKADLQSAKVDLVQVRAAVQRAFSAASGAQVSDAASMALLGQDPAAYEYHANDIIATLQGLLKTFNENKKQLDVDEFNAQAAFDTRDLDMNNQKKFQEKDRAEKEKVVESKTEELNAVEQDKTQETKDMQADQAFLQVVQKECEEKAGLWDQRSKTRSGELTAIAEALDVLTNKVAVAYGANEKLVGLQTLAKPAPAKATNSAQPSKAAPKKAPVAAAAAPAAKKALSFLQLRGSVDRTSGVAVAQRAVRVLKAAAVNLKSTVLSSMAARLEATQDHFVKVRSIIKDLIARLEDERAAEATQKAFCDKAMSESIASRDHAKAEIEQLHASDSALKAEKGELGQEIAELSAAVAELKKALLEASELRTQESTANAQTVATATEGKAAVELALKVLSDFYSQAGAQLLQKKFVPADADREGNAFGDLAPPVFQDSYHGDQKSSGGVLGLLEVILSDFARTIDTVSTQERNAAVDFSLFAERTEEEIRLKTETIDTHTARISAIEDALVEITDQLHEQQELLATAEATLLSLKAQCVDGEETYEERVAKRVKEIEALKEAKAILEEWQGF